MKIGIIGTGYVGLVTGICFASLGHKVYFYDKDKLKLNNLKKKNIYIYEKNLNKIYNKYQKNIHINDDLYECLSNSEVCMICVGTPQLNGKIDLRYIKEISTDIGEKLNKIKKKIVICIKSTVLPGTCENFVKKFLNLKLRKKNNYFLVSNPEFLAEGSAVEDFLKPDRIIIGADQHYAKNKMLSLYSNFNCKKILTNTNSAEMMKYTSNFFFSNLISFSNQIANICEKSKNVDAIEVMNSLYYDKRISIKKSNQILFPKLISFLYPGCGFGGSCFPKDTKALQRFSRDNNSQSDLIDSVLKINSSRALIIFKKIKKILNKIKNKKILILGLAFKPDTNDTRYSPSLKIIDLLLKNGAYIYAHDPIVKPEDIIEKKFINNSKFKIINGNLTSFLKNNKDINLVALCTIWKQYKKIDKILYNKIPFFDARRFIDKTNIKKYYGIGIQ